MKVSLKPRSNDAFVATIHPIAARLNLTPNLSNVTLANVLSGDTCSPISLADFEKHLTFVACSVECLQFLVWFQDYRDRFFKLPCSSPSSASNNFVFGTPNHAETERRAKESSARDTEVEENVASAESPNNDSTRLPHYMKIQVPPLAHIISKPYTPDTHCLKTECFRVVATFLSPGSAKELPLDAVVRDTVIRNLSFNCHPDVFLPVYEEIYSLLERNCLSNFLSTASANINLPKQIYWYSVGVLNIIIGLVLALSFIMLLPTPPQANRAWRLIAVGFCSLGSAQCYSAWRGYCSQVWLRGNTQLRVWEMQEMDEEAKTFVDRILEPRKSNDGRLPRLHDDEVKMAPGMVLNAERIHNRDLTVIAPFMIEPSSFGYPSHSTDTIPLYNLPATPHFRRPPVFGPEAVVQDPRIKAVHRQLIGEVVRFGLWFMLFFSAIIFSVPSRLHS